MTRLILNRAGMSEPPHVGSYGLIIENGFSRVQSRCCLSGISAFEPVNLDFLFHGFEFVVSRDEFGFLLFGKRGGEGIGQS